MFVHPTLTILLLPLYANAQSDSPLPLRDYSCNTEILSTFDSDLELCLLPKIQGSSNPTGCPTVHSMIECFYELLSDCLETEHPSNIDFLLKSLVLGFVGAIIDGEIKENPLAGSVLDGCDEAEKAKTFLLDGVLGGSQCSFVDSNKLYSEMIECLLENQGNLNETLVETNARRGMLKLCRMADSVDVCSKRERFLECVNPRFQRIVERQPNVVLEDAEGTIEEPMTVCEYVRTGADSNPRIERALAEPFVEFNPFWMYFKIIVKSPDAEF